MKIKRFVGPDMRTVIAKVRETLGPDAVILTNQAMDDGIEVVAALEYDESLFEFMPNKPNTKNKTESAEQDINRDAIWDDVRYGRNVHEGRTTQKKQKPRQNKKAAVQTTSYVTNETKEPFKAKEEVKASLSEDKAFVEMQSELRSLRGLLVNQLSGLAWENETKYHPFRARLLQRLVALGLSPHLAREVATDVNEKDDMEHNWRMALGVLSHRIPITNTDILNKKKSIIAIVGATGVGKTTTIAKLAARYILQHGKNKVALITTDNYRVAAHEQLRSYSRIMGAPMRVAPDLAALQDALMSFRDKELVLIDTAGMSHRDMRLTEQFALLNDSGHNIETYLAIATNSQRGVLSEVVKAFKSVALSGAILTKVDETSSLGGALSIATECALPVAYMSDGQQVPEDLHVARAHSLVSRAVSIMQDVGIGVKHDPISTAISGMAAHANG